MSSSDHRKAHWQQIWSTKAVDKVSWFQDNPALSLGLITTTGLRRDAGIVDVGGGLSALAGELIIRGHSNVAVLDIAEAALVLAHERMGTLGDDVAWICADVLQWRPVPGLFELWHDRAVFHFLTTASEQQVYVKVMKAALVPGGWAIIATFAPDGPETCSGLPVQSHDATSLSTVLGPDFALDREIAEDHLTPSGQIQKFRWCLFRRL